MNTQPIILFDGVCNFCNSAVNFVIKRDKKGIIKFAPLQSTTGQQLLKQHNLPTEEMNSFVFIDGDVAYTRSTASIKLCKYLGGLWPLCKAFIIVPKFIRDGLYNWIAKNRYRWFGQRESCMIPTPEVRARFLQ
ncbi:thiol-disulfide oxidoreductase DCC family protein [Ferruginibacter lapsinanis]|uniref:thiol-disulfide oxidoreductase DCC family protein n=1 Tax=Ferruginibacter lapsinanis TaxID=563172 RepID=UPI001E639E1F|nr:thiol-disulfide oxidoreductase DCC family protein [Ferruginibacter lapsinanis]UEG50331.1 thiol-disulfide oxidoreductase DCC family protein [Ferruginibacter lapsinanis]